MESESSPSHLKKKMREETLGFRSRNRMVYLKVKRGGLNEESDMSKTYTTTEVKDLAEKLKKKKSLEVIRLLRNSFCQGHELIEAFLSVSGGLVSLVGALTGSDSNLAIEACCCIINLTTGKHKITFPVLKQSAPYLITFLHGSNTELQDCSAWALGNMAADCNSCRNHLKKQGLLQGLLHLLETSNSNVLDSAVFALGCYTRFCDSDNRELCEMGLIMKIRNCHRDAETPPSCRSLLLTLLFNVTVKIDEITEFLIMSDMPGMMLNIISNAPETPVEYLVSINTLLVRCIGNMAACTDPSLCKLFFEKKEVLVPFVVAMLTSPHNHLKKECLWMLSNLFQNGSYRLSIENLKCLGNLTGDILNSCIDDRIIDECLNVFATLISHNPELRSSINRCLDSFQESLSKRPHAEEQEAKILFIRSCP